MRKEQEHRRQDVTHKGYKNTASSTDAGFQLTVETVKFNQSDLTLMLRHVPLLSFQAGH